MANPFVIRPPSQEERSWVSDVKHRDFVRDVMHINTELKNMYALQLHPPPNFKSALNRQLSALIYYVQHHMMGVDEVDFVGEIDPHFLARGHV
tara:strand:- start:5851 stop:6129 length:279 start_codon:yes stop_codon:yes gene_type:complete